MGIERAAVTFKTEPANLEFLDRLQESFFRMTRSSLLDALVSYLRIEHGSGNIRLTPELLQDVLRNDGKRGTPGTPAGHAAAIPEMAGPVRSRQAMSRQKVSA